MFRGCCFIFRARGSAGLLDTGPAKLKVPGASVRTDAAALDAIAWFVNIIEETSQRKGVSHHLPVPRLDGASRGATTGTADSVMTSTERHVGGGLVDGFRPVKEHINDPQTGQAIRSSRASMSLGYAGLNITKASMILASRPHSTETDLLKNSNLISVGGQTYPADSHCNLSPKIRQLLGRNLHNQENHPLCLIKKRIVDFFYKRPSHKRIPQNSVGGGGSRPLFSVHDTISPVVSTFQNFDSLLVTRDHVSRRPTDSYYINANTVLRSHTSAHEMDLIKGGLNAFLVTGDVYRRDDIDALHYPAFHQLEGVRLFSREELFQHAVDQAECFTLFEPNQADRPSSSSSSALVGAPPSSALPPDRQPRHTLETTYSLEFQLKSVLEELAIHLFGKNIPMRWVPAYFPFTHPSWELEIQTGVEVGGNSNSSEEIGWTEMLGCGILRQEILDYCRITNKAAYAFGLGLERWAMKLYEIPDIRLFWSQDPGFLNQFKVPDFRDPITYKSISCFPPCNMDVSFWLPGDLASTSPTSSSTTAHLEFERDFFELVRGVAGDLVEQVTLIDQFEDKKRSRVSRCYRIVYRDHHKTLTNSEVRRIHADIGRLAEEQLKVKVRL